MIGGAEQGAGGLVALDPLGAQQGPEGLAERVPGPPAGTVSGSGRASGSPKTRRVICTQPRTRDKASETSRSRGASRFARAASSAKASPKRAGRMAPKSPASRRTTASCRSRVSRSGRGRSGIWPVTVASFPWGRIWSGSPAIPSPSGPVGASSTKA